MKIKTILLEIDFKKWKKDNVTVRGINKSAEGSRSSILGKGLYTAPLANKAMAKQYGELHYVVNAIPKKPKIFNDLNSWEIFVYKLKSEALGLDQNEMNDLRDFERNGHTVEDEMKKLGYDGVIIKGREMVNYDPEDIKMFKTEHELERYFDSVINR